MAIKILRGYEADRTSITPEDGQLLVSVLPDGSRKLYVGDGITAGGKALTAESVSDFLSLTDTPSTYSGTEGMFARSTGSGIEFVEGTGGTENFIDLSDVPSTYSGTTNMTLVSTGTGLDWASPGLTIINTDTTIYVATTGSDSTGTGASGAPFATPQGALLHLKDKWINNDVVVTIQCADGTYTLTTSISPAHPCGGSIVIAGENTYTKSMTSVQSSSGSAGAWSVVINVDSVANVTVNDFVVISAPSGGTKPTYIAGCHKVTNVDDVNNRLTIDSKHAAATAPSGVITATVNVIKTIFKNSTTNIVRLQNASKLKLMKKCVLDGEGNSEIGMYITDHSFILLGEGFGISGSDGGIYSDNGSTVRAEAVIAVSGIPGHAYQADDGSRIQVPYAIASGMSGGGYGFYSGYACMIEASYGLSTGGGTVGFIVTTNGSMRTTDSVATAHTTGFYAGRSGYMYAPGATGSDNSANFSPTVNTLGNENGYIDQ